MKNTQKAAQKSCREVYKVLVKQLNRESIKKDCGVFRNAGPQCFVMCCRRAERLCREEPTPTQKLQIKATTLTPDLDCIHSRKKKQKNSDPTEGNHQEREKTEAVFTKGGTQKSLNTPGKGLHSSARRFTGSPGTRLRQKNPMEVLPSKDLETTNIQVQTRRKQMRWLFVNERGLQVKRDKHQCIIKTRGFAVCVKRQTQTEPVGSSISQRRCGRTDGSAGGFP